jgi:uncharacterized protein (DUF1810 family)
MNYLRRSEGGALLDLIWLAGTTKMDDPHNLQRFVDAQAPKYGDVCSELRSGKKQTEWMWFIFPQIIGLGITEISNRFAISSRQEAEAYLNHPVLGPRLRECTQLVLNTGQHSADKIFYFPDDLKFRSSMTLFAKATSDNKVFIDAFNRFYKGEFDPLTLERL